MSLYDGKAGLAHAAKKLRLRWEEARESWDDSASRQFEREHLLTLDNPLAGAILAIDRVSEVLGRAERDCR